MRMMKVVTCKAIKQDWKNSICPDDAPEEILAEKQTVFFLQGNGHQKNICGTGIGGQS